MLSSSLQLFLKEWVNRIEQNHKIKFEVNYKKKGWFNGYRQVFAQLELPMNECSANLEIIEQVALARNRVQHPEHITDLNVRHSESDLKKYPRPFFAQANEIAMAGLDGEEAISWWIPPSLATTDDTMLEAIQHIESLCSWLESEYWKAINA